MKIEGYKPPRSSFLSIEKDMKLIVDAVLANERLCKLLYYTTKDALMKPKLTMEQKLELFGNQIKIVPKIQVDSPVMNYLIINFDNFVPSENPEFRNNKIEFDILCHYTQWELNDFALRPYKIAAEIDSMFSNKKLTGIGLTEFFGAVEVVESDEFAGVCLVFNVYHGGEDKREQLTAADQAQFLEDFKQLVENQAEQAQEYPDGLQASLNVRE